MNRELPQLDQISVASPCHESWGNMQGDERARVCGQCRKHVYNLAEMTRPEIEALIIAKEGKFCARFYRRPDGTLLCYQPYGKRGLLIADLDLREATGLLAARCKWHARWILSIRPLIRLPVPA